LQSFAVLRISWLLTRTIASAADAADELSKFQTRFKVVPIAHSMCLHYGTGELVSLKLIEPYVKRDVESD